MWWHEKRATYPCLSRMARDYLSIPGKLFVHIVHLSTLLIHLLATSIDVERVFSQGRLLLSHVRSRLSVHSTRALLCLGIWSVLGLVRNSDVKSCLGPDEVGEEEDDLAEDWDSISKVSE
jgi:hypothetical protein